MTRDQFYITLPSNSSMQYFPDNRTCCYITQLPRAIELTGEWEVGLAEIHYPLTFASSSGVEYVIEPIGTSNLPGMVYDEASRTAIITKEKDSPTPPPPSRIAPARIPSCQMFVYCDLVEPRIVGDVFAPLLRVIHACGKERPIQGESAMKILSPPHYLPLMLTNFRTIEINIKDHTGRSIPFEYGTLTVTLHFKRVR